MLAEMDEQADQPETLVGVTSAAGKDGSFQWIEERVVRIGAGIGDVSLADHADVLDTVDTLDKLPDQHGSSARILDARERSLTARECIERCGYPFDQRSVTASH
jgi:hypothetical protein